MWLLLLAPTADAELRFNEPLLKGSPVAPLSGSASFTVEVAVDCEHVSPLEPATLHVEGTPSNDQIQLSGPPSFAITPSDCLGADRALVAVAFDLRASATAPGETPVPIDVVARLETTSPFTAEPVTHRFHIEVAPLVRCAVRLDHSLQAAEPGSRSDFPIYVANLGNTRSTVSMQLVQPQDAAGVTLPTTVLDSTAQGGTAVNANVIASFPAPASPGTEIAYQVNISTASVKDPSVEAPCGTFNVLVVAKSTGVAGSGVPGPGVLVSLAIVGAGLIARRRA